MCFASLGVNFGRMDRGRKIRLQIYTKDGKGAMNFASRDGQRKSPQVDAGSVRGRSRSAALRPRMRRSQGVKRSSATRTLP